MKLYLVLHGKALPRQVDARRPLSDQGQADVARLAAFLKPLNVQVSALWHSNRLRAIQTAQALAAAVQSAQGLLERTDLGPDDRIRPLVKQVENMDQDLMIVGHMPFLGKLASKLLVGHKWPDLLCLERGGLACLECGLEDVWRLAWMLNPDQLAGEQPAASPPPPEALTPSQAP